MNNGCAWANSVVVFDPEGDHVGLGELRDVLVTGGEEHRLGDPAEVVRLLRHRRTTSTGCWRSGG